MDGGLCACEYEVTMTGGGQVVSDGRVEAESSWEGECRAMVAWQAAVAGSARCGDDFGSGT